MVGREPRVVTRHRAGYVLHLDREERAVVAGLLAELRDLLTDGDPASPALARLFPVTHPGDPDQEAEYQRLMRDDLVTSRVGAIDQVRSLLEADGRKVPVDEAGMAALMQALNGVRLVLGTLLDVGEDDEPERGDASPEYALYAYLSYLLDACVHAASG